MVILNMDTMDGNFLKGQELQALNVMEKHGTLTRCKYSTKDIL